MKCVKSTTISVLVNGSLINEFKMDRGLHQGDPHSPFLFLIAAKCLNVMLNAYVNGVFLLVMWLVKIPIFELLVSFLIICCF